MATSKIQAPQAIAFNSDPEQQIYARGVLGDDSGLAYMFKNAADSRHARGQQQYMQGVSEANKVAAALAQQELMSAQAIETLKQAVEMSTKLGSPTSSMPIMSMLFPSGADDPGAAAKLALVQSEIAQNNAQAAGGGGGGGETKWTWTAEDTGNGPGAIDIKGQGRNITAIEAEGLRRLQALAEQRKKGGALAPPPINKYTGGTQEDNSEERRKRRERQGNQ